MVKVVGVRFKSAGRFISLIPAIWRLKLTQTLLLKQLEVWSSVLLSFQSGSA